MESDLTKTNAFLHYGYIPDSYVPLPDILSQWFNNGYHDPIYEDMPQPELITKGGQALKTSFQKEIKNDHGKFHIVPLSGGLDSRTILANLLEHIDPANIIAVTFGMPDAPDYWRARSIAKKAGVRWENIDLSADKWYWDTELLIGVAKRSRRPTWLFDNSINNSVQIKFGMDCVYWSGFMGDSFSRLRLDSRNIKNWEDAKIAFAQINHISPNQKLTAGRFVPEDCLPEKPYTGPDKLDYYSQLNFCIRQQCLTRNIYSPAGYDIRYPFLNADWVSFILGVPNHNRYRQRLYREIQQSFWPNLFNKWNSPFYDQSRLENLLYGGRKVFFKKVANRLIPSLALKKKDISVNYIDWNYALRYQSDFKELIFTNLQDLKSRNIIDWLDMDRIWADHQNYKLNLSKGLMTLAALEIHLKTGTLIMN